MWASRKRVATAGGLVHLYRLGNNSMSICDEYMPEHTTAFFETPTCLACIAYWTHPCSETCAASLGCHRCEGPEVPR